jgi:hypothetical protein
MLAAMVVLVSCGEGNKDDDNNNNTGDGITWTNEPNGTLTIINGTNKDMVLFEGQTPSIGNILGGVRATEERKIDISAKVSDFNTGGYIILRGISKDEYEANKANLSRANIDYSAMATYGQGKQFRAEISANYIGDYGFRATNSGRIGMELRKGSPDGEKIAYLPSLASNFLIYSDSNSGIAIFPVYVYFNRQKQTITTVKPTSHFESVTVAPRDVGGSQVPTVQFPADSTLTWEQILADLSSPVAYFNVSNNVQNQGAYFTIAGGTALNAQNGYDMLNSGEQLTFELESTAAGTGKNIVITLYSGQIRVPARFAGETTNPVIENGYDYTITLNHKGGAVNVAENYEAILEKGEKRNISNEIESL